MNKNDLSCFPVVFVVVSLCLRPFWSVFSELALVVLVVSHPLVWISSVSSLYPVGVKGRNGWNSDYPTPRLLTDRVSIVGLQVVFLPFSLREQLDHCAPTLCLRVLQYQKLLLLSSAWDNPALHCIWHSFRFLLLGLVSSIKSGSLGRVSSQNRSSLNSVTTREKLVVKGVLSMI